MLVVEYNLEKTRTFARLGQIPISRRLSLNTLHILPVDQALDPFLHHRYIWAEAGAQLLDHFLYKLHVCRFFALSIPFTCQAAGLQSSRFWVTAIGGNDLLHNPNQSCINNTLSLIIILLLGLAPLFCAFDAIAAGDNADLYFVKRAIVALIE